VRLYCRLTAELLFSHANSFEFLTSNSILQYLTTKQSNGTLQILLNHLSANEYKTITSPNNYLPQPKDNGECKRDRERRDLDTYINPIVNIIDLIAGDGIERRAGGVYEMN
jgi:hypothetical protein